MHILICLLIALAPGVAGNSSESSIDFLIGDFSYSGKEFITNQEVAGTASGKWELDNNWLVVRFAGYWNSLDYFHENKQTTSIEHCFFEASGGATMRIWKLDTDGVLNGKWQAGPYTIIQVIAPSETGFSVMRWRAQGNKEKHLVLRLIFTKK